MNKFIEKWNKIYTAAGRFYPFRLFAGVKHKASLYPSSKHNLKRDIGDYFEGGLGSKIYDWDLVGDNKNDALEPTKYYTLEPNPQAERIDEKDLPKDKLYYVWIADKMFSGYTSTPTSYDFKPLEQVREEQQRDSIKFHIGMTEIGTHLALVKGTKGHYMDLHYFYSQLSLYLKVDNFTFGEVPDRKALWFKCNEEIKVVSFEELWNLFSI